MCCRCNVAVDAACCAGECGTVVPRPHWAAWAACYEPALPLSVCLMSGSRSTSCACTCFCVSFGHGFETFVSAIDTYRLGSVGQTSPQKPKWCSGALPRCDFQPPSPAERTRCFVESQGARSSVTANSTMKRRHMRRPFPIVVPNGDHRRLVDPSARHEESKLYAVAQQIRA